jgi:hypothetical protein
MYMMYMTRKKMYILYLDVLTKIFEAIIDVYDVYITRKKKLTIYLNSTFYYYNDKDTQKRKEY